MGLADFLRDGEPEAATPGDAAARGLQPVERAEHVFQFGVRDAGAAIEHADVGPRRRAFHQHLHRRATAVALGVLHQVDQHPAQRRARDVVQAFAAGVVVTDVAAAHRGLGQPLPHQRFDVHQARRVVRPHPAREVHELADQRLHGVEVEVELLVQFRVRALADHLQREAHARERGAQVVRDAGEQGGAVADELVDPCRHLVERADHRAHLGRAAFFQPVRRIAVAELARGGGEPGQRAVEPATEPEPDEQAQGETDPQGYEHGGERRGADAVAVEADQYRARTGREFHPVAAGQVLAAQELRGLTEPAGQRLEQEIEVGDVRVQRGRWLGMPGLDEQVVAARDLAAVALVRSRREAAPALGDREHERREIGAGPLGQRQGDEHRAHDQGEHQEQHQARRDPERGPGGEGGLAPASGAHSGLPLGVKQ